MDLVKISITYVHSASYYAGVCTVIECLFTRSLCMDGL